MSYYKLNNAYYDNHIIYMDQFNFKENYAYRLGDMIRYKHARDTKSGYTWHKDNFSESIATKYMELTKDPNNYDVLLSIIDSNKYKNYKNPNNNELIIHLRVGDVIDNQPHSVNDFLHKSHNDTAIINSKGEKLKHTYVYNLEHYNNILQKIPSNIKNIILVYGYHIDIDHSKSEEYVNKLKQFFESKGFNITKRTNGDADNDFIYMSNAKHFVPSGGGFSKIISKLVKLKNNNVY